jgi:hypothetical protein
MLQSASGGTTPPPGYVGLEVRTLPLSNLVRACFLVERRRLRPVPGGTGRSRCWGGWTVTCLCAPVRWVLILMYAVGR